MLVHQCHSSIIPSGFRVRLGLGVEKWSRLHFWIKMLFQGQQYIDPGTNLTLQNHDVHMYNRVNTVVNTV